MIRPTVGRVVWVRERTGRINQDQPEVGLVTYVHSDNLVNVAGFDANGEPFRLSSLTLRQAEDDVPVALPWNFTHAEWMPYQRGQAARTVELEQQIAKQGS
jgi:hypothetical protein